jgi:putative GTP pyrophosphokinase
MELSKEQFLMKYKINQSEFDTAQIKWVEIQEIYNHYIRFRNTLKPSAETIANILRTHPDVHSVRTRIKDPEHLIDKIIRKTLKKIKVNSDYKITIDNYRFEITDLIGVRVLHLYKDQAAEIDKFIREFWDLKETCTIYYREGDYSNTEKPEDNTDFNYQVHPAGYRSWHYLISSKITRQEHITEIQVRTIFEEGWSEIDHQLRYPNDIDNILLTEQLLVLNRIAGSADELSNTIRETKINMGKLVEENKLRNQLIEELKDQLDVVLKENEIKEEDRKKLEKKVKELEASKSVTLDILGNSSITGMYPITSETYSPLSVNVQPGEIILGGNGFSDRLYVGKYSDRLTLSTNTPKKE